MESCFSTATLPCCGARQCPKRGCDPVGRPQCILDRRTQWRSRSPSLFRVSSPGFCIWRFGYSGNQGEICVVSGRLDVSCRIGFVGLPARRHGRLLPARQARRQCLHGTRIPCKLRPAASRQSWFNETCFDDWIKSIQSRHTRSSGREAPNQPLP